MADSELSNVPEQSSTEPSKEPVKRKNESEEDEKEEDCKRYSVIIKKPKLPPKVDNKLHFSTGTLTKQLAETNQEPDVESRRFHFESSKEIQVQHDSRDTSALETETDFSNDALKKNNKDKMPPSDEKQQVYKGICGYTVSGEKTSGANGPLRDSAHIRTRFHFESSKEIQVQHDSRDTATLETETDFSNDALKKKNKDKMPPSDEKQQVYKGIRGYTVSGEKAGGAHGPLRASAHIRTSTRWDYLPDICKDYKQTGHYYKSGWQMEKEWEEAEKIRKRNNGRANVSDDDEDALPFACFICRQTFVDDVLTKCKHYFRQHCALKHIVGKFACNTPTLGMYDTAHQIKRKMAAEDK
ncbi:hypothetical protein MKX03_032636 [Papaver bracteatum]|nr:hypothetical protein MKX03_032636 [Papaver bracteatum]